MRERLLAYRNDEIIECVESSERIEVILSFVRRKREIVAQRGHFLRRLKL